MTTELHTREQWIARAPLVGRIEECAILKNAMQQSIDRSKPHVVTVVGTAGIGKSRLVSEAIKQLKEMRPSLRSLQGPCRPEHGLQGAIARMLRSRFGIQERMDANTQTAELRLKVSELFGERRVGEMVHFLGAAMGIQVQSTALVEMVDEDSLAREAIARSVLRKLFEVDAHRSPLILVFEDLHDAGPEGARFLRQLLESMGDAPVCIFVTTRPELLAHDRDWPRVLGDRHTRIDLGPLNAEESAQLARAVLTKVRDALGDVPAELVEAAVEMGSGSPLLLEQIARIFFESEVVGFRPDGTAWVDVDKLDTLELPMSVEDAVRSRLAALSPTERELLERGAVMGPVFWLGGLVVLGRSNNTAPELWGGGEDLAYHYRDLLAELEAKDFVLRMPESTLAGDEEYIFKHNLEREMLGALVAAQSAQEYHLLLAEWLEFRLADRNEEQLDLLAEHYEKGDRALRAARCYLESADRARTRFANAKAVEQYRKGLSLLGDFDVRLRLDAHHHLGDVLQRLGQTDAALEEFRSMLALAFRLDQRAKGGAAHNRIGRAYREVGQLELAMRHLGTALALFQTAHDERGIASTLDDIGKVHWLRGSYEQALRFLRDGLTRREALGDPQSIALSLHNIGSVQQDSGEYREALESLTKALELRRASEDLPGLVSTLNNLGTIHQDRGEHEAALQVWVEALGVAREIGDRRREALLLINIGEAQYRLQRPKEAIRILREVETICTEIEDRLLLAEVWRGLGTAHLMQADLGTARNYLEQSVDLFDQTRSRVNAAIARRSLAECLATGGHDSVDGARAEELFRESLVVLEVAHNEIEWARSARSFALFLRSSSKLTPALSEEADRLTQRANELRLKLNLSALGLDPTPLMAHKVDDGHGHSHQPPSAHIQPATAAPTLAPPVSVAPTRMADQQNSMEPAFDVESPEGAVSAAPVIAVSPSMASRAIEHTKTAEVKTDPEDNGSGGR